MATIRDLTNEQVVALRKQSNVQGAKFLKRRDKQNVEPANLWNAAFSAGLAAGLALYPTTPPPTPPPA